MKNAVKIQRDLGGKVKPIPAQGDPLGSKHGRQIMPHFCASEYRIFRHLKVIRSVSSFENFGKGSPRNIQASTGGKEAQAVLVRRDVKPIAGLNFGKFAQRGLPSAVPKESKEKGSFGKSENEGKPPHHGELEHDENTEVGTL
ncbi:hypothetical protein [Proteiniclasticum sediminis]|uniref:hypothetical protein n=1 Tax=Proteiniclasticum sediminis TaxID=2804028 RepID=UPI001BAA6446|nr:hypothetical protein [Proteiniclasticum sediminis]